jgi:hypothetical protein
MKKHEAQVFVQTELDCIRASIDNLLNRYVQPGSDLAGHIIRAEQYLGAAQSYLISRSSFVASLSVATREVRDETRKRQYSLLRIVVS